jgi:hypothetical protein
MIVLMLSSRVVLLVLYAQDFGLENIISIILSRCLFPITLLRLVFLLCQDLGLCVSHYLVGMMWVCFLCWEWQWLMCIVVLLVCVDQYVHKRI